MTLITPAGRPLVTTPSGAARPALAPGGGTDRATIAR